MNTVTTSSSSGRVPARLRSHIGQGVAVGLVPLALVTTGAGVTLLLSMLALRLTGPVAFTTRQALLVGIVGVGMLLTAGIYAMACVRVLRRVSAWERMELTMEATAALWALAVTALVVFSPVLIAILLPAPSP